MRTVLGQSKVCLRKNFPAEVIHTKLLQNYASFQFGNGKDGMQDKYSKPKNVVFLLKKFLRHANLNNCYEMINNSISEPANIFITFDR